MKRKEPTIKIQNDLLKITHSLNKNTNLHKSIQELTDLLCYIDEKEINKYITKIQNILLIKNDDTITKHYSNIVRYYKSTCMFDAFFDFFWLSKNENLENEIVELYEVFGDYYYKYYKEIKDRVKFELIVRELEDKCKKEMNKI
ncbi:hypothetical protein BDAP_002787 [Binucleata daphniae]